VQRGLAAAEPERDLVELRSRDLQAELDRVLSDLGPAPGSANRAGRPVEFAQAPSELVVACKELCCCAFGLLVPWPPV
jgi:hypothetical protein